MRHRAQALWPVALLALCTSWCGTIVGGASAAGALVAHGALLLAALAALPEIADPWRLGRRGRWWLGLALLGFAVSAAQSDFPRAGRVAWALLPLLVLLPTAVARAWADPRRRRLGLLALAALLAGIALWSLAGRFLLGDARAARPLGHHGLMAFWWLAVLPLLWTAYAAERGWRRAPIAAAAMLAGAALLAGGSLLGVTGLALQALWLTRRQRHRRWLWWLAGGGLVLMLPRLAAILAGRDASALARGVYWQGGLVGWLERPWLGWGPGTTPWTLGLHLEPRSGISPPGEVVAELHNLPLQVLYELGLVPTLFILVALGLFGWRHRRGAIALVGLAGAAWAGLGTAWLAVLALPVAVALVAGVALATSGAPAGVTAGVTAGGADRAAAAASAAPGWRPVAAGSVLVLWTLVVLWAPDRGHWLFDHRPDDPAAARRADPAFPLYAVEAAWSEPSISASQAASDALEAARGAPGVAAFWLTAGIHGGDAGRPWADDALALACQLDPLSPLAPFYRVTFAPQATTAPIHGARALLAEPRLAAARFWEGREELLSAALDEVESWPGLDAGWRGAMVEQVTAWDVTVAGDLERLALAVDGSQEASLRLRTFRRSLRPRWLFPVEVRAELARQVTAPAALVLPFHDAGRRGCDEGIPQLLWKTLRRTPGKEGGEPRESGG